MSRFTLVLLLSVGLSVPVSAQAVDWKPVQQRLQEAEDVADAGDHARAAEIARSALVQIEKTQFADDDLEPWRLRNRFAWLLYDVGDAEVAIGLWKRIHDCCVTRFPKERVRAASALALAQAYQKSNRMVEALPLQEEGVELLRKVSTPTDAARLESTSTLAEWKASRGDSHGAAQLYALLLQDCSSSPDLASRGVDAEVKLAGSLADAGDTAGAIDRIESLRKRLPAGDPHRIDAVSILGRCRLDRGELDLAEAALEEAERGFEAQADCKIERWKVHRMRGIVRRQMGDLADAEKFLREAVEGLRGQARPDDDSLLDALSSLANLLLERDDPKSALSVTEECIQAREPKVGEDRRVIRWKVNAACCLFKLGRFDDALTMRRHCLDVLEVRYPDDLDAISAVCDGLSQSLARSGDLGAAIEIARKGVQFDEKRLPPNSVALQDSRINLADLIWNHGDQGRREVVDLLDRAVSVLEQVVKPGHPSLQLAWTKRATALARSGDVAKARLDLRKAVQGELMRRAAFDDSLGERGRAYAVAASGPLLGTVLSLEIPADPTWTTEQLEAILSFRAGYGRLGEALARLGTIPGGRDQLARLTKMRATYANCVIRGDWKQAASLAREVESLEASAVRELAAVAPGKPAPTVSLAALSKELSATTALIVVQQHPSIDLGPVERAVPVAAVQFTAFVLANGVVKRVPLGDASAISDACAELRKSLSAASGRGKSSTPNEGQSNTAHAKEHPLGPRLDPLWATLPAGVDRLIILPDASLASIPWDELVDARGNRMGDGRRVDFWDGTLRSEDPPLCKASLLVVGGVDFGGTGVPFKSLPGSEKEAKHAEERFRAANLKAPCVARGGRSATKAQFLSDAPGKRWIHLSTHGFADALQCLGLDQVSDVLEHRSMMSRLAFAGANDDLTATLTSGELGAVNLRGCELVVLSACETSVGQRMFGESVSGLEMALAQAGVRWTITSLWPVDDVGACDFFDAFYGSLWKTPGTDLPTAFQRARQEVQEKGWGPSLSSGFVLTRIGYPQ